MALYVFVILIPSLALLGLCDDDSMRGKALLCALFALVGRFSRITEKLPEMFYQMMIKNNRVWSQYLLMLPALLDYAAGWPW